MQYISTRGTAPELNFEEAMLAGLARDGGLYVPKTLPKFDSNFISSLGHLSYEEIAFKVMKPFVGEVFEEVEFKNIIHQSYSKFVHQSKAPLRQLSDKHYLLELYHGPTLAFKDFAMQLIGQLFRISLSKSKKRVTIIGATSGDTGSAAIEAFKGLDAVDVFILYPRGRVSEVQRRQMSTPSAKNVHAISIDGDFDDCQKALKDLFNDLKFRDKVNLSGVNSINWARIMAQIVYYFSSYSSLDLGGKKVRFTVPTGNFGDIFAGYIAKKIGLPISKLIIATNQNDILHNALISGEYVRGIVNPSISPSMDIQVSSNFERALYYALKCNADEVTRLFSDFALTGNFKIQETALNNLLTHYSSGKVSEDETSETINNALKKYNVEVCPHTAIGLKVAEDNMCDEVMITLATAHPAKFFKAFESSTGKKPVMPKNLSDLFNKEERITELPNNLDQIKRVILERI